MKISALTVLTAPAPTDSLPILDDSADTTKQITLATLLGMIYPVGSLYFNASDATNPGTLLGFGTWAATAVGRVPVGKNASDVEFDTVGETGGEKAHTLTVGEMPSHGHNIGVDGSAGWASGTPQSATQGATGFDAGEFSDRNGTDTASNFVRPNGGGAAHNNLQPYEVYYIWKRTA